MKAAQLDCYAKAGRLVVREMPVPEPKADEILIRVRTAAVNPLELLIATGSIRLIQSYRLPQTLGNECSGVVELVGSQVRDFRPGDAVYTRLPLGRIGAFAEYVVVAETAVAKMPAGYAFDVAAAIPLTGQPAVRAKSIASSSCMPTVSSCAGLRRSSSSITLRRLSIPAFSRWNKSTTPCGSWTKGPSRAR